MPIIDIVALGIIAVFAIIGVFRGLAKTIFKLFGVLLAIVLAFYSCPAIGKLFATSFGEQTTTEAKQWLVSIDEAYTDDLKLFTVEKDWTNAENKKEAMVRMGVPSLFSGILTQVTSDNFNEFGESAILSEVLPPLLTQWAMTAIAFLVLLLIYSILILIVKSFFKKLIDKVVILKIVDKIGGFAAGVIIGVVVYSVIFFIISYIPIPFLADLRNTISNQLVESKNTTNIAAWLAETPIITFLVGLFKY